MTCAELDEASWLAMESGQGTGGTLNACNASTWACAVVAGGLDELTAVAIDKDGRVSVVTHGAVPGAGDVSTLP